AEVSILAGRPKQALAAADRALAVSPFVGVVAPVGAQFTARVQGIRGEALLSQLRIPEAVAAFEAGVRNAPYASPLQEHLYARLADAYYQNGRYAEARTATSHLRTGGPDEKKKLEWLLTIKQ